MNESPYQVLDARQINRIEAVHGGFLYQHLYAEWVRIHPFANGNGRTAHLWANSLAPSYGLSPLVDLRPRHGADYEPASEKAMRGDWEPTAAVLDQLLEDFRRRFP